MKWIIQDFFVVFVLFCEIFEFLGDSLRNLPIIDSKESTPPFTKIPPTRPAPNVKVEL